MNLNVSGVSTKSRRPLSLPAVSWALGIDLDPTANLWQDVARSIPALAHNDPVASAKYDTGKYVITATVNERPLLKVNSINGRPTLEFDGSNDTLYDSGFLFSNPFTFFAVLKVDLTSTAPDIIVDSTSGSTNRFVLNTDGSGVAYQVQGSNVYYLNLGEYVIVEAVVNGASSYGAINGYPVPGNFGTASWAGLRLGKHATGAFNFDGSFARILAGTGALSAADATKVRRYLSSLYNIKVWPDLTLGSAVLVNDGTSLSSGISYTSGVGNIRQVCSGPGIAYSGYTRLSGLNTETLTTKALLKISANHGTSAIGGFTANEAKHAGIEICATNKDNNYILMISQAASAVGENDIQLVKQVGAVETILYMGKCSETILLDTFYLLELRRNGASVEGFVKKEDGTTIGSCSVTDSSLTTGNSGTHGFSVTYEFKKLWIE